MYAIHNLKSMPTLTELFSRREPWNHSSFLQHGGLRSIEEIADIVNREGQQLQDDIKTRYSESEIYKKLMECRQTFAESQGGNYLNQQELLYKHEFAKIFTICVFSKNEAQLMNRTFFFRNLIRQGVQDDINIYDYGFRKQYSYYARYTFFKAKYQNPYVDSDMSDSDVD